MGEAVWCMSYGGEYPDEAIPALKNSLALAYKAGIFCGGRGMDHILNGYEYQNSHRGGFDKFTGRECIRGPNGEEIGHHEYSGLSLL